MPPRSPLSVLWALVLAGVVGCAPASSAAPPVTDLPADVGSPVPEATIVVRDNHYEPGTVTVEAGGRVTWSWEGRAVHDVLGDGFHSEIANTGEFVHEFAEPGSYGYVCTLHPGMEGTVHVVP